MTIEKYQKSFQKDILKIIKRYFALDKIRLNKRYVIKANNFNITLNIKKYIPKRKIIYNYENNYKNNLYNKNYNKSVINEEMKDNYSSNESMEDTQKKESEKNKIINNGNILNEQNSSNKQQNSSNIYKSFLNNNKSLCEEEEKKINNQKKSQSSEKAFVNSKLYRGIENKKFKENYERSNSLEKIKEEEEINEINNLKPKGLYNLGLNCYMNSLLQCLFYIKELRDYFIENKDKFKDEQLVCKAFSDVIHGLKEDEKDYFVPREFKKLIGNKNNLFGGVKAGDVKDLFFNLIDSFLTELNKEYEDNDSDINIPNYSNEIQMFEEAKKEIDQNNHIINELFIGYYNTKYDCDKSKESTYSFQTESFILFELEKIQHYFSDNELTFELLFSYYIRKQEKSSFYCNYCKKTHIGDAYERIYRPPKIFVIILDRGHGKTFNGKVEIKKYLDLKPFIHENNYKYSTLYELICISSHRGKSSSSGHYTSCCKTDNNKYYYFSDTYVKEIKEENLIQDEPYLLFYKQTNLTKEDMNKINKAENDKKINNIKLQNKNYSFNTINKRYNENGKKYNNNIQRIDQNISSIVNNANYHNLKYKKQEAIENNFENKKNRNLTSNKTYLYKIESKEIKYALEQFLYNSNNNYKVDYYYPTNKYNNIWKLTILGPKKTPYDGKKFNFK